MIWVDGRIVPDDHLTISARDRTFQHGLGLFETLRTWNGRAPLLDRHLARMRSSARALGLMMPRQVPDADAVEALLRAQKAVGDVTLRITLSGGLDESSGATLWMNTATLPFELHKAGAVVELGSWKVLRDDSLARHKTLNYWTRRRANEAAQTLGYDEALSTSETGSIWEGSRTNLFVVRGETLITPTTDGPIVPGVMRALVLVLARSQLPFDVREITNLTEKTLSSAGEVFLTNSVRGLIPVSRIGDHSWPSPGPCTQKLKVLVADVLNAGGSLGGFNP